MGWLDGRGTIRVVRDCQRWQQHNDKPDQYIYHGSKRADQYTNPAAAYRHSHSDPDEYRSADGYANQHGDINADIYTVADRYTDRDANGYTITH